MINILVNLIEKIIYKFIPRFPYFMRTSLYRKFLLFRKLRDYLILAKGKLTYEERLEYADNARSKEHLICELQKYNNDVRFSHLDLDTLDIFKSRVSINPIWSASPSLSVSFLTAERVAICPFESK